MLEFYCCSKKSILEPPMLSLAKILSWLILLKLMPSSSFISFKRFWWIIF